jgi:hypothetical protein
MESEEQDASLLGIAEGGPHDEIARLEAEIEELTGVIERSRKIGLAAKAAIVAGGLWLLVSVLGVVSFAPVALISALAAVIGGIVVFGSNTSTSQQAASNLRAAESRRSALIDQINPRVVH